MPTILCFDLETYLIRTAWGAPKPVVSCYAEMEVGKEKGKCHLATPEAMVGVLKRVSEDPNIVLLAQNLPFDCMVMMEWFPETVPYIFKIYAEGRACDITIREKLRKCALGRLQFDYMRGNQKPKFHLANMVDEYFGIDISAEKTDPEAWRLRYAELDGVPFSEWPKAAIEYCHHDVELALDVFTEQITKEPMTPPKGIHMLEPEGFGAGWRYRDEVRQTRAHLILSLKNNWGLRTSASVGREIEADWDARTAEAKTKFKKFYHKKGTKNMAAIREAVEAAYAKKGEVPEKTKGGAISCKRLVLQLSGDQELIDFADIMEVESYRSKFLKIMVAGTVAPIHAFYDPVLATGRVSLSRGLHQLPRKERVREAFEPRDGWLFIGADYSSIEMATLAQHCIDLCGYSKLADDINAGKDPHLNIAAQLAGISYDEALERKKAGDKEIAELRQHAKPANFGFPGGMGPKTFVAYALGYGVNVDEAQAAELRRVQRLTYPELNYHFEHVSDMTAATKKFTQLIKRSGRQRGRVGYCDGCNGYFQSPAADGMKEALFWIGYECYNVPSSPLFGCRGGVSFHDEEMLEAPAERAPEAADRLVEVMIEKMQPIVPDVTVRAEPVLMERWYKDAETVRDENGRLQVWKPTG